MINIYSNLHVLFHARSKVNDKLLSLVRCGLWQVTATLKRRRRFKSAQNQRPLSLLSLRATYLPPSQTLNIWIERLNASSHLCQKSAIRTSTLKAITRSYAVNSETVAAKTDARLLCLHLFNIEEPALESLPWISTISKTVSISIRSAIVSYQDSSCPIRSTASFESLS